MISNMDSKYDGHEDQNANQQIKDVNTVFNHCSI